MANNLRKFQNEAEYSAATLNYPAVSWVVNGEVHFDKTSPIPPFGGLTVKYNVTQVEAQSEIALFNGGGGSSTSESSSESESGGGGALPTRMIVDGVEETPINTWRFETAGEHIVQYEFADNAVPVYFIKQLSTVKEVVVGNDITSIGYEAILGCGSLTSATIGSGVTLINNGVFYDCTALTSVTVNNDGILSQNIPTLGSMAFDNTNNCPIYVPASAVDTYKASTSTGWSTYANRIQAIQ